MAAKKKATPSKAAPVKKSVAKKTSTPSVSAPKKNDLGSERSVMRQVNRINNVDRERQKNNPDFKGIFSYTSRDKKGKLKANWDNYISLDGKLGRPKNLRLSAKPAEKNKKKK
jgi:hypothetical protein